MTPLHLLSNQELYDLSQKVEFRLKAKLPKFKLVDKKESRFMIFLSYLLWLFNRYFMTDYTTTIGYTIYLNRRVTIDSSRWELISYISLLLHEGQHMLDNKKYGILFPISYLCPQIFAVLALFSFFSCWWLLCILFLAPIPSLRAIWEIRGYKASIASNYWLTSYIMSTDRIIYNFTSSAYYFMFPFKNYLIGLFERFIRDITKDSFVGPVAEIKQFLDP
jgi:hypothetical protein